MNHKRKKRRVPFYPEYECLYNIACGTDSQNEKPSKVSYECIYSLLENQINESMFEVLRHRNVCGYRIRITTSGKMREVDAYPIWKTRTELDRALDGLYEQSYRDKVTYHDDGRSQRIVNERNARKTLVRRINANFTDEEDLYVTFTYEKNKRPDSIEGAAKDARNLVRRLKRARDKKGLPEMKYIYILEEGEKCGAKHIHMVMSGGLDQKEIKDIWNTEGREKIKRGIVKPVILQANDFEYERLGRYFSKAPKGKKRWCCSKNLIRPEVSAKIIDFRLSRRQAEDLAQDAIINAPHVFERMRGNQNYRFLDCEVKRSEFVAGAYIYARMRRKE